MNDFTLSRDEVMPECEEDANADLEIAVVCQLNLPDQNAETYGLLKRFTSVTVSTLRELGARVLLVDVTADEEPDYAAVARADAVVILGGGDVESWRYGHTGVVPNQYGVDGRSDERQLRIVSTAIADDSAMLAICRGSQLLNVACGGTLIPDLEPATLHRGVDGAPMFHDEEVLLEEGTRIAAIFAGRSRITVRSGHHQAVDVVGERLRVTARAHDGVIEGTEHVDGRWIVGVQWHPEDDDGSDDDRRKLFGALVEEARRRKAS